MHYSSAVSIIRLSPLILRLNGLKCWYKPALEPSQMLTILALVTNTDAQKKRRSATPCERLSLRVLSSLTTTTTNSHKVNYSTSDCLNSCLHYMHTSNPTSNPTSSPTSNPAPSKPADILIRFYIPTFSNIFIYLKQL